MSPPSPPSPPSYFNRSFNYWAVRKSCDSVARWFITFGGISVILSIVLIGVFLFSVVFPMLLPASIDARNNYTLTDHSAIFFASDDYQETAYSFSAGGTFRVWDATSGTPIAPAQNFTNNIAITSHALAKRTEHTHIFGRADGSISIAQIDFTLTYPDNVRQVITSLKFPFGEAINNLGLTATAIDAVAFSADDSTAKALIYQQDSGIHLAHFAIKTSFATGHTELELLNTIPLSDKNATPLWLGIDQLQQFAYVLTSTELYAYAIEDDGLTRVEGIAFSDPLGKATTGAFLLGNISLLVGFDSGAIAQIFPVRSENNQSIPTLIRTFPTMSGAITTLAPEYIRRGFAAGDANGTVSLFFTTNGVQVGSHSFDTPVTKIEMAPRHNAALVQLADGSINQIKIENEYPESSISSLWQKIWYEFYPQPDYVWQSTSADTEFEPKLSLVPLTFGTLKAAFYAMLLAIPIAIMAAIYTAFFLSPRLRQVIKPAIELMEAMPTVILGFLAGLWLAPTIENNLTFLFTLILLTPPITLAFGFAMHLLTLRSSRVPAWLVHLISAEWRIVLVIPLLLVITFVTLQMQSPLESLLFASNLRDYISNDLGIGYDQRNAVIIGIAMGFAVIPTIFSITEDAIFSVPQNLVSGSLALGASRWQSLMGVVIPSASPGIFSAVMIGFGRAVGETMIVLMATGNTPIMDWNMFEGLRTLSANIAVEMPESENGSTHYRILFLSALVLFIFTFILNTIAEVVRQNLRKKYGS